MLKKLIPAPDPWKSVRTVLEQTGCTQPASVERTAVGKCVLPSSDSHHIYFAEQGSSNAVTIRVPQSMCHASFQSNGVFNGDTRAVNEETYLFFLIRMWFYEHDSHFLLMLSAMLRVLHTDPQIYSQTWDSWKTWFWNPGSRKDRLISPAQSPSKMVPRGRIECWRVD